MKATTKDYVMTTLLFAFLLLIAYAIGYNYLLYMKPI